MTGNPLGLLQPALSGSSVAALKNGGIDCGKRKAIRHGGYLKVFIGIG
jgi:hypothetical protein